MDRLPNGRTGFQSLCIIRPFLTSEIFRNNFIQFRNIYIIKGAILSNVLWNEYNSMQIIWNIRNSKLPGKKVKISRHIKRERGWVRGRGTMWGWINMGFDIHQLTMYMFQITPNDILTKSEVCSESNATWWPTFVKVLQQIPRWQCDVVCNHGNS